jgi:hypothetical protein
MNRRLREERIGEVRRLPNPGLNVMGRKPGQSGA